jgi:hypothetical protein
LVGRAHSNPTSRATRGRRQVTRGPVGDARRPSAFYPVSWNDEANPVSFRSRGRLSGSEAVSLASGIASPPCAQRQASANPQCKWDAGVNCRDPWITPHLGRISQRSHALPSHWRSAYSSASSGSTDGRRRDYARLRSPRFLGAVGGLTGERFSLLALGFWAFWLCCRMWKPSTPAKGPRSRRLLRSWSWVRGRAGWPGTHVHAHVDPCRAGS